MHIFAVVNSYLKVCGIDKVNNYIQVWINNVFWFCKNFANIYFKVEYLSLITAVYKAILIRIKSINISYKSHLRYK